MLRLNPYAITAYSWCNALGTRRHPSSPEEELTRWPLNRSGLRPAEGGPVTTYWGPIAGPLPAMPEPIAHHRSRCSQLFWASLKQLELAIGAALRRWGPARVGLVVGSSTGGIDVTEQVVALEHQGKPLPWDYDFDAVHPFSALVHMARTAFGFAGPGYVISTACSSGAKALASAQRLLETGICDAVITGGADALCQMTLRGFASLGILSEGLCRPFDRHRDGINIGEGSAVLLVERRSASPLVLLSGGESSDAYHTTAPHPEGLGARLALQAALELAGLAPDRVDYVNAHGTGTRQNDSAEALVLASTLGERVAFSSTKDRVGHQLGAAGATEVAFCLDSLLAGRMPGNRPGTEPDPNLAVHPLPAPRSAALQTALSNSFAFGGSNAVIALGRGDAEAHAESTSGGAAVASAWIEAVSFWALGYPSLTSLFAGAQSAPERPPANLLPARPRGRASLLTRLFAELLGQLTAAEHLRPEDGKVSDPDELATLPVVYGSALGEMSTTLTLLDQIGRGEELSPVGFQSSVHNTAAGVLSIALANRSFSTALSAGSETFAMSLLEALSWLASHGGRIAVLVADEDAPSRLMRAGSFPAAGIGFLLRSAEAAPSGALGKIRSLQPGVPEQADDGAYGASVQSTLAARAPGLERAPASQGLVLARALLEGRAGRYAIGEAWSVLLEPVAER